MRAVLDAAPLPTVLYDYPDRTGVSFTEKALDAVAADPLVVGIKEASGDLTRVRRLRRRYGADLPIVCGADSIAMRYFEMGVDSWIGGVANALPAEHVALLEAALAGDTATAWAWQKQMMPMLRSAERTHYTPKVRHALELRGVTVGPPRPPLAALDASEAHEVATRLAIALGQTERPALDHHPRPAGTRRHPPARCTPTPTSTARSCPRPAARPWRCTTPRPAR